MEYPMTPPTPVALITGSARRIGAAVATHLHQAGYNIVLHANRSSDELQQAAFAFELARPGSVLALQADLREADALADLVEQAVAHFGRLDALVNNASNFFATPLGQITAEAVDDLYAVNARAPLLLAQAAAPHLRRSHGSIVNLTDLHGSQPMRDHPAYCMAKAALEMVTRSLALELAPKVRVNAVAPGAILWPEDGKDDFAREALLARTPLARIGTVEEVAEAVRWLIADAGFVTGHTLRLDGGRTLS
jgi:pteridine reductase